MENIKTKLKIISTAQILCVIFTMFLFLSFIPWIISRNIQELSDQELIQKYPIPKNAKAFTIGHGVVDYFPETTKDNPIKFYGIIVLIIAGWIYIIISSRYSEKIKIQHGLLDKNKSAWYKNKKI